MRHRVFISHCEEDHAVALDICHRIERRGVKCWIAPRDVVVGEDYLARIGDAIEGSAAFVVVLSHHTNQSKFVKVEAEYAFNDGMTIFPVRIENVEIERGLRLLVSINHRIDAFGANRAARLEEFADAVVRKVLSVKDKGGRKQRLSPGSSALMAAIGPGAADFLAQWRAMDARASRIAWSWEAALGGPFWPFYRGMVLAGIGCALLLALAVVIGGAEGGAHGALAGFLIGWAALALLVGLTGSAALRRHVGESIRRDRSASPAMRAAALGAGLAAIAAAFATTLPAGTRSASLPLPVSEPSAAASSVPIVVSRPREGSVDPLAEQRKLEQARFVGQIEGMAAAEQQRMDEANAAAAAEPMAAATPEAEAMIPAGNAM